MTPENHNKMLGICHIAYGGLYTLFMGGMMLIMLAAFSATPQGSGDAPPPAFLGILFAVMFFVFLLLTLPSFIAGYALLKRRKWAKVASIVAAVFETMNFPFGTAVCVYSLWFAFGDAGKSLYDGKNEPKFLKNDEMRQTATWTTENFKAKATTEWQGAYNPPTQPPDWRK